MIHLTECWERCDHVLPAPAPEHNWLATEECDSSVQSGVHRTLAEDDFLPPVTDNSQPVTSEHFTPGLLNALFFVKHAQLTDDGFAYLDNIVK